MSTINPQNKTSSMKYLKLSLVIAVITILFSACKKDKAESSLIGTWNAKMIVESAQVNGAAVYADTLKISGDQYMRLTFMADNKAKMETNIGGSNSENGYYSVSGNKVTLGETADDPEKQTYDYQLSGSSLILSYEETEVENGTTMKYKNSIHLTR